MIELEKRLEKLKELTEVQCSDGNYTHDDYMLGLANGMILAVAILEDKEPQYKEVLK